MDSEQTSGIILENCPECSFNWDLENFVHAFDRKMLSPDFYYHGTIFNLSIFPVGRSSPDPSLVDTLLTLALSVSTKCMLTNLKLKVYLRNVRGSIIFQKTLDNVNLTDEKTVFFRNFVSKNAYLSRKDRVVNDNNRTRISFIIKSNNIQFVNNSTFRNIMSVLNHLLHDVTNKACAEETVVQIKEQTIKLHNFVQRMFPGFSQSKLDVDEDIIKNIIKFIYKGQVPELNMSIIFDLYICANTLESRDLQMIIENFILKEMSRSNIFEILLFCEKFNVPALKQEAEDFFIDNFEDICKEENYYIFKLQHQDIVMKLLERTIATYNQEH